jgi:hypothetical protein
MRREEVAALGDLAGEAAGGLTTQIQQVHSGIAQRVWRAVGPAATPVRLVRDQVASRSYSAARGLTRGLVRGSVRQTNHFELLNHPATFNQISRWMAPRPALPASVKGLAERLPQRP